MIQQRIPLCESDSNLVSRAARMLAALKSPTTYIAVQELGVVIRIASRVKPEDLNSVLGAGDGGQQELKPS